MVLQEHSEVWSWAILILQFSKFHACMVYSFLYCARYWQKKIYWYWNGLRLTCCLPCRSICFHMLGSLLCYQKDKVIVKNEKHIWECNTLNIETEWQCGVMDMVDISYVSCGTGQRKGLERCMYNNLSKLYWENVQDNSCTTQRIF